jgi:hypothetical protein
MRRKREQEDPGKLKKRRGIVTVGSSYLEGPGKKGYFYYICSNKSSHNDYI